MTALVLGTLAALGLVDGVLSGFRSSLGRSGLVDHRATDRAGLRRGLRLFAVLALPVVAVLALDLALRGATADYGEAATLFLAALAPYAALVVGALVAYGCLGWRHKYLAAAVILGPFTLARPYIVIAAAAFALLRVGDAGVAVTGALAVVAVLLVEPLADRLAG